MLVIQFLEFMGGSNKKHANLNYLVCMINEPHLPKNTGQILCMHFIWGEHEQALH